MHLQFGTRDPQLLAGLRGACGWGLVLVVNLDEGSRRVAQAPNRGSAGADEPAHLRFWDHALQFRLRGRSLTRGGADCQVGPLARDGQLRTQWGSEEFVNHAERNLHLELSARHTQLLARLVCAGRGRQVIVVNLDEGSRRVAQAPNRRPAWADEAPRLLLGDHAGHGVAGGGCGGSRAQAPAVGRRHACRGRIARGQRRIASGGGDRRRRDRRVGGPGTAAQGGSSRGGRVWRWIVGEDVGDELQSSRDLHIRTDDAQLLPDGRPTCCRRELVVVDLDEGPRGVTEFADGGAALADEAPHLVLCDRPDNLVLALCALLGSAGLGAQDLMDQRQRHLHLRVCARHAQLLARLRRAGWRRLVLVVNLDEGPRRVTQSPNRGSAGADEPAHLRLGE
eukprot:scaffold15022_cov117-Isochrysis_galbana.AAC.18